MRNKIVNKVMISSLILIMSGVLYTGCNDDETSDTTTVGTTYSGVVADGYIQGATVCLDLDGNGTCDAGDPTATTGANGEYTLNTSVVVPKGAKILASGGIDTYTGESFNGKFVSPLDLKDGTKNNLTPLTALISGYLDSNTSANTTSARANIASGFGIDSTMIAGDPFAKLANGTADEKAKAATAIKQAYKIQKIVEMLREAAPVVSIKDIFKAVAKAHSFDIDVVIAKNENLQTINSNRKAKMKTLVDAIDSMDINGSTVIDDLKTKQRAIQVATEIVNSDGITTINGTLLNTLVTKIRTKKIDSKAMAASLGGTKSIDNDMLDDAVSNLEKSNDSSTKQTIVIDFSAIVGDQGELVCSKDNVAKTYTLGKDSNSSTIADFRFFVSDVNLKMSDGTTKKLKLFKNYFQYEDEANGSVAILDFEDNTGECVGRGNDPLMNKVIVGSVDSLALVEGIEFTIGVPNKLNHTEFTSVLALSKSSMAWSWASGRKFMKLEANPVNGLSNDIFNFHLGSTGCSTTGGVTTCTQPNRVKMSFDFNPKTQKIVLDYSKLLTDVAVDKNLGGAAGCMSALNDPECMSTTGKMMNKIGLNDAGALGVCIGGECAANQQLFSIKSK